MMRVYDGRSEAWVELRLVREVREQRYAPGRSAETCWEVRWLLGDKLIATGPLRPLRSMAEADLQALPTPLEDACPHCAARWLYPMAEHAGYVCAACGEAVPWKAYYTGSVTVTNPRVTGVRITGIARSTSELSEQVLDCINAEGTYRRREHPCHAVMREILGIADVSARRGQYEGREVRWAEIDAAGTPCVQLKMGEYSYIPADLSKAMVRVALAWLVESNGLYEACTKPGEDWHFADGTFGGPVPAVPLGAPAPATAAQIDEQLRDLQNGLSRMVAEYLYGKAGS